MRSELQCAREALLAEAELERRSTLVELPVLFTNETASSSFDFERWAVHRGSGRYARLLIGILLGVTTRRIGLTVALLVIFSAMVDGYAKLTAVNPSMPEFVLPLTPFELTAPVLGLLLVFRTNTAYERFDTGSAASWEISNRFRSVMRQLISFTCAADVPMVEREAASELIDALLLLHNFIMSAYLRGVAPAGETSFSQADVVRASLGTELEGTDVERLDGELTPWLGLTAISCSLVARLPSVGTNERIIIDNQLTEITSSLSICEKLLRTPIPLGYTRYSVRFLWIWLTLLPFALTNTFAEFGVGTWWENKPQPVVVLAMLFIGFIFLSIEDIAVQIEEPFAILPLEEHQRWLERDAQQMKRIMAHHKRGTTQVHDMHRSKQH